MATAISATARFRGPAVVHSTRDHQRRAVRRRLCGLGRQWLQKNVGIVDEILQRRGKNVVTQQHDRRAEVRLLLDEHISPDVAYWLNADGYDVVPLRDRGLLEEPDWKIFQYCQEHQFTLCTKNGPDFEREHRRSLARGEEHCGVLAVEEWSTEEIYGSLRAFLVTNTRPLKNRLVKVPMASIPVGSAGLGPASLGPA
jgi:predicted nuclease of predicted toxin-antitoxin system